MSAKELIKQYIKDKGIKLTSISERSNMSLSKLSALLTGRQKIYLDDFITICTVLEVDPSFFLNTKS